MEDQILKSGRDTLLVAIPFVMCLVASIFRLDGLIFKSPKSSPNKHAYPLRGESPSGKQFFTDPDGKVVEWRNHTERRSA